MSKPDRFHGRFLFVSERPRGGLLELANIMIAITTRVETDHGSVGARHGNSAVILTGDHRKIRHATRGKGSLYRPTESRRLAELARKQPELKGLVANFERGGHLAVVPTPAPTADAPQAV